MLPSNVMDAAMTRPVADASTAEATPARVARGRRLPLERFSRQWMASHLDLNLVIARLVRAIQDATLQSNSRAAVAESPKPEALDHPDKPGDDGIRDLHRDPGTGRGGLRKHALAAAVLIALAALAAAIQPSRALAHGARKNVLSFLAQ
jgi:hypothetical protein